LAATRSGTPMPMWSMNPVPGKGHTSLRVLPTIAMPRRADSELAHYSNDRIAATSQRSSGAARGGLNAMALPNRAPALNLRRPHLGG
jgi:hypothetical protein